MNSSILKLKFYVIGAYYCTTQENLHNTHTHTHVFLLKKIIEMRRPSAFKYLLTPLYVQKGELIIQLDLTHKHRHTYIYKVKL